MLLNTNRLGNVSKDQATGAAPIPAPYPANPTTEIPKQISIAGSAAIKHRDRGPLPVTRPQEKSPSPLNILFEYSNGGCVFSLSWEAVPQFCTSIRETFLTSCRYFLW